MKSLQIQKIIKRLWKEHKPQKNFLQKAMKKNLKDRVEIHDPFYFTDHISLIFGEDFIRIKTEVKIYEEKRNLGHNYCNSGGRSCIYGKQKLYDRKADKSHVYFR